MKFTEQRRGELIDNVIIDVCGQRNPNPATLMYFLNPQLSDRMTYSDPDLQFVLETIIMGSTMPDAFDNFPAEEAGERGFILKDFLKHFGIVLSVE